MESAHREYLPRGITETLSTLDIIDSILNICILGPSDSGKSYLAKAIGIAACTTYRVEYHHCESLLEAPCPQDTGLHQIPKAPKKSVAQSAHPGCFLLHTISHEREAKILFEILKKRCEIHQGTIICSQREPASWSAMILNAEVTANAILKRATRHYTVVIKPQSNDYHCGAWRLLNTVLPTTRRRRTQYKYQAYQTLFIPCFVCMHSQPYVHILL